MRLFSIANGYLLGSIDIRRRIISCLNPGVTMYCFNTPVAAGADLSRVLAKIYNSKRV